ncbi:hypothetical protein Psta_0962 [Pirellula staleyi DSM 6068]|uniref:Uncharacterized protein n=1 Tax=Pirellula staleyi (strain ATCC 27377 / DSM 6068 / ICPB 4128) TaxID=530564 RepID=D2R7F1_PIRSD|nr:hypothetical protein [Pirellula staleyi]ADB15647.1 hypothetical protein Psta_0962 [Pirellula staleyi DSM 6068]
MVRMLAIASLAFSIAIATSYAANAQEVCENCEEGAIQGWAGNRRVGGAGNSYSPGGCQYRAYGQPDLFYNYYTGDNCGANPAQMYLSPRPVPAHVGHTYITYQPLMPHEFLYPHHRTYHRYYNGGQGLTRTSVHYYSPLFRK